MGEATRTREETAPENAQFSTGPRSEAGKAISSMNAVKHGMRATKRVLLRQEDAGEYAALEAAFTEEFAPQTQRERALVESLALWTWKRARMDRIEAEFWERGYVADAEGKVSETPLADMLCRHGKEFSLILRYSSQASRGIEKAEKELRFLQERRRQAVVRARMDQIAAERAAAAEKAVATGAQGGRAAGEDAKAVARQALAAAGIQLSGSGSGGGGGGGGGSAAGTGQQAAPLVMVPARRQSQFLPGGGRP